MKDVHDEDAEFEAARAVPNVERRLSVIPSYSDVLETTEQWQRYHEACVVEWQRVFDEQSRTIQRLRGFSDPDVTPS